MDEKDREILQNMCEAFGFRNNLVGRALGTSADCQCTQSLAQSWAFFI
jgi:hypothetical protein